MSACRGIQNEIKNIAAVSSDKHHLPSLVSPDRWFAGKDSEFGGQISLECVIACGQNMKNGGLCFAIGSMRRGHDLFNGFLPPVTSSAVGFGQSGLWLWLTFSLGDRTCSQTRWRECKKNDGPYKVRSH